LPGPRGTGAPSLGWDRRNVVQALIGETVVAEAKEDELLQIEGNLYFPPESVKWEFFEDSATPYTCPWKGKAQYWSARTPGGDISDAAWSYPSPLAYAIERVGVDFSGYIAFDRVRVRLLESRADVEAL
jgi:uncharacterized protein (DUF427 family)